MFMRTFT
ncbi:hypothetical protein YPPY54_3320, partial [Yersinia pestis PY-54]